MNIEKSIEILKALRNYNKFYKEENKNLTITITLEAKESIDKAIERLLTAYEELKEENEKYKNPPFFDEENYTSNDKIKAKIEEVKDGTFDAKIVLQSLLEKE